MSNISFENYGRLSREGKEESNTLLAGRLNGQEESERNVFLDIVDKLKINSNDRVLDIGCGPGSISIPLSFICKEVSIVDHKDVLLRLKNKYNGLDNLEYIDGDFININFDKKFNKIIIYSVLHYLENHNTVINFVLKAVSMLEVGGAILLGDIPNISKKERFSKGEFGKKFIKNWSKFKSTDSSFKMHNLEFDVQCAVFGDSAIMSLVKEVRLKGFNAYILEQNQRLPFCYTREDILITHPDYKELKIT